MRTGLSLPQPPGRSASQVNDIHPSARSAYLVIKLLLLQVAPPNVFGFLSAFGSVLCLFSVRLVTLTVKLLVVTYSLCIWHIVAIPILL